MFWMANCFAAGDEKELVSGVEVELVFRWDYWLSQKADGAGVCSIWVVPLLDQVLGILAIFPAGKRNVYPP